MRILLHHGADVHARTSCTYTPLHHAAKKGRDDLVRLCLEHGAVVSVRTVASKSTPLHEACKKCHFSVVDILLRSGADPEPVDSMYRTPMRIAAGHQDKRTERLLVRAGAVAQHLQPAQTEEEQAETQRTIAALEEARKKKERETAGPGRNALLRSKTKDIMKLAKK